MRIPHLPPDQYEQIFRAGFRIAIDRDPLIEQPNPYDPVDAPCEYRAWLRGLQAGRKAAASEPTHF